MHPLPHHYKVVSSGGPFGNLIAKGIDEDLPPIEINAPVQYGGPKNTWSPETLLPASLSSCLILTFDSVAEANHFHWHKIECQADGTLDRKDGARYFVHFSLKTKLFVPPGTDKEKARRLLRKAEENCLITQSLKGSVELESEIIESQ
ncbi:organic hydroperoxide reductase [Candidatus Methylacidiphilum fumarolicum]|uniref:Organic hydroperoxide reductase n=2 Tax=Candidatus Methylacidiphilum fumarolicum TaxID=591154 RepID=I0JWF0_METFB|nr:OsmC family protein [Candidatus Methylacidiphilum fumarolicum]MBW6415603.1 OsmC family protein [Candidatus Methylacidiphilum fumarolicum]TFE66632.1 organic hydroperoxide reductase [Candidatus Methylacidiphilum fumarolicum]TFE73376.1 organic hydroperoxide reductase [Candidatus Methylacidiphilum fumarolicum]TFE75425.1 organic hydroperoxide reductase [Candidatus Methylacidiphilum fumarolicum]TFE76644.1 organic hydroperoxide reductase [Candidatus Methylacidiphilum fumarolicum]